MLAVGALLAGCPQPQPPPSDAALDVVATADPTLELEGRPTTDCTELRFVVGVRANGQVVAVAADALMIGVTPVVTGDAAAPMEQPAMNACAGASDGGTGYTVCLRGLMMNQPYFVRVRAPFDGGTLQFTTYLTPMCVADAGTDAATDAPRADATPPPPDAPADVTPPPPDAPRADATMTDATMTDAPPADAPPADARGD